MKKHFLAALLISFSVSASAQFSLYNSRTLFDAFENPSQKAFYADSSRKYAFNFLIPTVQVNTAFIGPAQNAYKSLLYKSLIDGTGLDLGNAEMNTMLISSNNYVAQFRIFRSVPYDTEMGFAWQVRTDGRIRLTNETFALFNSFRLFPADQYNNVFNNSGYNQSYHQFSFSYRENFSKRLGLGAKISLLSGITYNKLDLDSTAINIDRGGNTFDFYMRGNFRSSYKVDRFEPEAVIPLFKNPGFALTASANYKFRNGWYALANLKDIGIIRWSKDSYDYDIDRGFTFPNAGGPNYSKRLRDFISGNINLAEERRGFTTFINGKAEVLINKDLERYQPNLILSKNLFYPGADIVLANNYKVKNYVFTLSGDYNTNKFFQIGAQAMIKSPNTEFFIGTDQLFKTYQSARGLLNSDTEIGRGYSGASVYLGFSAKFGRDMEHQANANSIPGFSSSDRDEDGGFFKRLFTKKPKQKRVKDRDDDTNPDF